MANICGVPQLSHACVYLKYRRRGQHLGCAPTWNRLCLCKILGGLVNIWGVSKVSK